jgi:hypothetical protein
MTPRNVGMEHQTHRALGVENHGNSFRGRLLAQNSNHHVVKNLDAWLSNIELTRFDYHDPIPLSWRPSLPSS